MSDDGSAAVVVIAMLGCPFSPRYARARARAGDAVDPLDFSAFNVAITAPRASRWALTERSHAAVSRDATALAIGRSSMRWTASGGALTIDLDERTAPWGRPLRGRISFEPAARTEEPIAIDGRGAHLWWPMAPHGRVEVTLQEPNLRFRGTGYLDANAGDRPLEADFARWSWARISTEREVDITYDVVTRDGRAIEHGYRIDPAGRRALETEQAISLGTTRFGLSRSLRPPVATSARIVRTVEDGPFYARSIVECGGRRAARGVHEVVSLDRFASSWVQFLIPFRMRREAA